MMRVLHINSSADICGGVEVYLRDLFDSLPQLGVEPLLAFGMGRGSGFPGARYIEGLNASRTFRRRDPSFAAIRQLCDEFRPDVIHLHAVGNQNVIEACLESAPTLLHLHDYRYLCPAGSFHFRASGTNCNLTAGLHCLVRGCTQHCVSRRLDVSIPALQRVRTAVSSFGRFAGILANSMHVHHRLLAAGAPVATAHVLHYFCSYSAPSAMPSPASPAYVLFVGRISPIKGTEDFVGCVARLPAGVRGVIVGEGTRENEELIWRSADRMGCRDRIELLPWKSRAEVAQLISGASVMVVPSIWEEPFGLVGLESQVLGVPVVGYGHGGVTDWLRDGVTGLSVSPRDVPGLASCVNRIMGDPELRQRLVSQASAVAVERFGRQRHLDALLAHYRSASRGPGPQ